MSAVLCDTNVYSDLRAMNMYDSTSLGLYCPRYSSFFGVMGCSASMYLCAIGAAYGTAKCGTGLSCMAIQYPDLVLKNLIPVVMASVIAIYGLVVSVLIANGMAGQKDSYSSIQCVTAAPTCLVLAVSACTGAFSNTDYASQHTKRTKH